MIYIEGSTLEEKCDPAQDCALLIGMHGETDGTEAHARLRVLDGINQLKASKPVQHTHCGIGNFTYFWFYSDAAATSNETWQHTVALGVETLGADFDLYVTVMDGRYPTETDYDFKSTNRGADVVFISPELPLLSHSSVNSYNPAASGMLIMVGVRAMQDEEADFSLFVNGPELFDFDVKEIIAHDTLTIPVPSNSNHTKTNPYRMVFKWYNWGHTNFKVNLRTIGGSFRIYLNSLSET